MGRGARGARAAAGRPPDAARRHADGPHRGRAARPHRPRARVAGARRQCPARPGLDRRWRRLRPLGAGLAGDAARSMPSAGACRSRRSTRRQALCSAPRSRRSSAWVRRPIRRWPIRPAPSRRRHSRRPRPRSPSMRPRQRLPKPRARSPRRRRPLSSPLHRSARRRLRPSRSSHRLWRRASRSDAVTKPARPPQAETPDEDDLRERIRLAAQRAIAASNVPEPVAAKSAPVKAVPAKRMQTPPPPRPRRTAEPKIFVPPRAPDDPGPEPTDGDGLAASPLRPVKI